MSSNLSIPAYVVEAALRWQTGFQSLQQLHNQGTSGKRISIGFSDLLDEVVQLLYRHCLDKLGQPELDNRVAVVLHGGCGRREVCPFSDVDLLLLCHDTQDTQLPELAKLLSQAVTDAGFRLGFSVQSPRQACSLAFAQAEMFTSLVDSRFLAGSIELFDIFLARMQRLASRRCAAIMRRIYRARETERVQFGESAYLLRPNVKKSRGGLRDIHLVRWIGFVRYGEADIDRLGRQGEITQTDIQRLHQSTEFLLRIRNELHFHAKRNNDGFGRNEQVRIAEKLGYGSRDEMLPVEGLMRDYFRCTSDVRFASDHFVNHAQPRPSITSVLEPIVSRNLDENFRISPFQIGVRPAQLDAGKQDLGLVLRLLQLANLHNRELEPQTWEAIRSAMIENPATEIGEEIGARFMALIGTPEGLGKSIRRLHEMQVLEQIIPGFRHARGLMQFNEYHQYTVDEHSIQAIERVTEFRDDPRPVGEVYRSIKNKSLLHLALLVHDLGKGFPEDHSEVGRRIAEQTARRLGLDPHDGEMVKFLVHNHLMMSHLALHRDINDESVVAEFVSNVGTAVMLDMLYVLTCADIAAVGPRTLTEWKLGLLTELHRNARMLMTGTDLKPLREAEQRHVFRELEKIYDDPELVLWLSEQASHLPRNQVSFHGVEQVGRQLLALRSLGQGEVTCTVDYLESRKVCSLCIGTHERVRSGIFIKINRVLASMGLRIRSADIKHLGQSLVWYWFLFRDRDFSGPPPAERLDSIRDKALAAVNADVDDPSLVIPRRWAADGGRAARLSRPPIRVVIDNQTVDNATIIDVYAYDKMGLLFTIGRKIFEMGLDVCFARSANYGHQVVAVFYVTDEERQKIHDAAELDRIQQEVLSVTRDFLEPPQPAEGGAS